MQHVLKSDLALRELEHVQVNSPGLAYLFFYDSHGCHGLTKEVALAIHSHIADAFAEWIGRSMHFDLVPLLLEEGHQHVMAAQERCRQCIWTQEQPGLPIHMTGSGSSGSSQLVGRVPPIPEAQDGTVEQETPRVDTGKPHRHLTKARPAPRGGGGIPPSSPEHPGVADSNDYSTASESGGGCRCRRCWQAERRLAPVRSNLPIFRSMDANADVTYEIWHFNVLGWLDQYDEMSMHPHIFGSLQGYPSKWAPSLPGGMNISLDELLRHMDCTFGNMCNYDSMIWSLYEIHQKEHAMVEEHMLRVHEAVAVVKCVYPDQVPNEGEGLRRDCSYYGLIPSLRDVLTFTMVNLLEREQADTSFNTLYHLAKKLEVHHQSYNATKGGALTHDSHKGYKKYSIPVGHAATVEMELFPPDPDLVESAPPEPDHIEGLSLRMTQAMNHYQKQELRCFMCGDTGHFTRDCPHSEASCTWYKEHLNSLGAGQKNRTPTSKNIPLN